MVCLGTARTLGGFLYPRRSRRCSSMDIDGFLEGPGTRLECLPQVASPYTTLSAKRCPGLNMNYAIICHLLPTIHPTVVRGALHEAVFGVAPKDVGSNGGEIRHLPPSIGSSGTLEGGVAALYHFSPFFTQQLGQRRVQDSASTSTLLDAPQRCILVEGTWGSLSAMHCFTKSQYSHPFV